MSHWFYITPEEYTEAEKIGVKSAMLDRRIREQGWTKERAMTTPPRPLTDRRKWLQLARENGISRDTFYTRIRNMGWSMERAANQPRQTPEEIREQALRATEYARVLPKEYVRLAEQNSIPYATFHNRLKNCGWELERAAEPIWTRQQIGRLGAQRLRERGLLRYSENENSAQPKGREKRSL
ncbi:hypothetical protein ASL14_19225 [Paenibacillus sp. IHB B 3084]|uniref:hypothetical protein n=1 Tax=Paenibacillus sp. IHB B 3084 TaxID=867076 RepID=UPI0007219D1A|nr:hypothetical protein [Paenibacillus sp. IHB B 3084]ALP38003.1 hypothetical protein ASL14_19225 [Paenibacillus sp. IHB B 3084]